MRLTAENLNLHWPEVERRLRNFIKDYVRKSSANGVVLGLSGGIDSCTVAALCARAISGSRVLGLMLPENETRNSVDILHASQVAQKFGLKTETIDITTTLKAFYRTISAFNNTDKVSKGNIKARTRMIYLYYYANRLNMLVCGSSDKSETMMGYFTKWGDVAADISPIMDLYKTQVRKVALHIGVQKEVVDKAPSPALWPGQLAEKELGVRYEQLDLILYGLEHFMPTKEIARQLSIKKQLIDDVKHKWLSAEHKRRMLLTAKVEYRTVGTDFRLARDPW